MRILFIAPRLPYPLDSGAKIRNGYLLKYVIKRFTVDFVCFSFDPKDEGIAQKLENDNFRIHLIPWRKLKMMFSIHSFLLGKQPYSIAKYNSQKMKNKLLALNSTNDYNLINIESLHMAQYQCLFKTKPCIIDEHNVEFHILERCFQIEKSILKKILFLTQAKKTKRYEREQIKKCTRCFVVSDKDKYLLSNILGDSKTIQVIPNGVDTTYFKPAPHQKPKSREFQGKKILVFTGSMDWLPNDDAVLFCIREIMPHIWKEEKSTTFYVVGKNPSQSVQEAAVKDSRIVVTGYVHDVRPFLIMGDVFIVPLRIGSGTRIKILEAMSMHKPIVSTTLGAEGISYSEGKNILIANEGREFAINVLSLLSDNKRAQKIGQEAREFVCENYDWKNICQQVVAAYDEVIYNC